MADTDRGISRRRLTKIAAAAVAGAAVAAPTVVAAATSTTDPIFAAIQRNKDLWTAYEAVVHEVGEVEETLPHSKCHWCWAVTDRVPPNDPNLDPHWVALQIKIGELGDAYNESCRALLEMEPATMLGVAALLRYTYEVARDGDDWGGMFEEDHFSKKTGPWSFEDWNSDLHRHLADAVDKIARKMANTVDEIALEMGAVS